MGAALREEEVHLAFPAPTKDKVPLTSKFRSTWLTSSLRAIKERQRHGEYLGYLPAEHREAIESSVAGIWLPTEVAVAHYEACDRLGFTTNELYAIGREVHAHAQLSVFSMAVKLATGAGATPWTAFSQFHRLWSRVWVGGGTAVFKLGPKEARIEIAGWQCAGSTYCRVAMRGVVSAMVDLFCKRSYLSEIPRLCTPTTLGYRCAWA